MLRRVRLSGQKKQHDRYSGKKKRHTIKTQLAVNKQTQEIICTTHSEGKTHDFKLYEQSIGCAILERIKAKMDLGCQGILRFHKNSEIPNKKPKGRELTAEEKEENKLLSSERVLVENIIAKIKVFKIMSNKYRNRRKRFGLRMALICGIINQENRLRN
jgi:hypothetical protein